MNKEAYIKGYLYKAAGDPLKDEIESFFDPPVQKALRTPAVKPKPKPKPPVWDKALKQEIDKRPKGHLDRSIQFEINKQLYKIQRQQLDEQRRKPSPLREPIQKAIAIARRKYV